MNGKSSNASRRALTWSAFLLTSSVLGGAAPAFAQDASTLGELIVTAQRRSETLQSVPMSIQAIGERRLEELNVTDVNDFSQFLPSLTLQSTGPGITGYYMRGVASGENRNHSGPLPSVGVYLDEQPITTITGALDVHIYDIARIEALAGPQGTLYGASSQAGTVRIITNRPDASAFSAGYNVDGNTVENGSIGGGVEGFLNIPLASYAALRIVGWAQHDAGYIDNVPGTRTFPTSGATDDNTAIAEDDYNDVDTYGLRAAMQIDLDESWTVTPAVMAQDQYAHGISAFDPQVGDLQVTHWYPEDNRDRWVQAALTIEGQISNLNVIYAGSYLNRAIDGHYDYSDYAFFYDTLHSYGAYFYDNDGNFINPAQRYTARDGMRKMSHELRISTPEENRFRVLLGAFYQRQVHDIFQEYKVAGDLADALEVPGHPDTIWLTDQERIDRDAAVFGEVSFDFTDRLTGTAGIRLFDSNNSLEGFFGFSDGYSGSTGMAGCTDLTTPYRSAPCRNLDKSVQETGSTHRLNLTYEINDDSLIYATWSTGFRPGGVNRRGSLPPYDSDFLTNYEAGWKTSWMEDRLRWNGAVFFEQWEEFQYSLLGVNGLTDIRNAGNAEIYGVESDINWLVTEGLTVSAGGTWLHSETTEDICDTDQTTGEIDCVNRLRAPAGTPLPVTPEFKGNLTARYEFSLGSWDAHLQGSVVHQTESGVDIRAIEDALVGDLPAFTVFDFAAGAEIGNVSFEIYLDNAFDERAIITRYGECSLTFPGDYSPLCGLQPYDVPIQPRTLGIRFGQRF